MNTLKGYFLIICGVSFAVGMATKSILLLLATFFAMAFVLLICDEIVDAIKGAARDIADTITESRGNKIVATKNKGTNFAVLLKDVPEGDWVAISPDGTRVLAHGPNFGEVWVTAPEGTILRKFSGAILL